MEPAEPSAGTASPGTAPPDTAPSSEVDADVYTSEWDAAQDELRGYENRLEGARQEIGYRVLRVNQYDAAFLDTELMSLLYGQLKSTFSLFRYNVIERFRPELDATLSYLVYHFTIAVDKPTPGKKLQGLTYTNGFDLNLADAQNDIVRPLQLWQKRGYCVLFVFFRWGWERLSRVAIKHNWSERRESDMRHRLWNLMQRLETLYKAASLLNLLAFLYQAKYTSALERLLGMQLMYINRQTYRAISFEYINRQLLWGGFAEMLLFVMYLCAYV